jgi:hypothetical protein
MVLCHSQIFSPPASTSPHLHHFINNFYAREITRYTLVLAAHLKRLAEGLPQMPLLLYGLRVPVDDLTLIILGRRYVQWVRRKIDLIGGSNRMVWKMFQKKC